MKKVCIAAALAAGVVSLGCCATVFEAQVRKLLSQQIRLGRPAISIA